MALDGYAALTLQIHVVEHLAFCYRYRIGTVDMGYNAEVSYIVHQIVGSLSGKSKFSIFESKITQFLRKISNFVANKIKNMRKPLLFLFTALVLVACNESLEDRAEREAREYTARYCPTPVVNNSRTDSVAFDKATKTYTYYCTLTGEYDSAEFIAKYGGELNSRLRRRKYREAEGS